MRQIRWYNVTQRYCSVYYLTSDWTDHVCSKGVLARLVRRGVHLICKRKCYDIKESLSVGRHHTSAAKTVETGLNCGWKDKMGPNRFCTLIANGILMTANVSDPWYNFEVKGHGQKCFILCNIQYTCWLIDPILVELVFVFLVSVYVSVPSVNLQPYHALIKTLTKAKTISVVSDVNEIPTDKLINLTSDHSQIYIPVEVSWYNILNMSWPNV